jgi:hypothetical protein
MDKTWCKARQCAAWDTCDRAATPAVLKDAERWWGRENPPIMFYSDPPDYCFQRYEASECCVFLGTLDDYDLYYCDQGSLGIPTVIARWGTEGNYKSGMCFANGQDKHLTFAKDLAKLRELL